MTEHIEPLVSLEQLQTIDSLPSEELNLLPFGAIKLSLDGRVVAYNQYESRLSGRSPLDVIGKDFFHEVAPCTNVQTFGGRFREAIGCHDLHVVFPYRFDFKMTPTDVAVTLAYRMGEPHAWIFVARRNAA